MMDVLRVLLIRVSLIHGAMCFSLLSMVKFSPLHFSTSSMTFSRAFELKMANRLFKASQIGSMLSCVSCSIFSRLVSSRDRLPITFPDIWVSGFDLMTPFPITILSASSATEEILLQQVWSNDLCLSRISIFC